MKLPLPSTEANIYLLKVHSRNVVSTEAKHININTPIAIVMSSFDDCHIFHILVHQGDSVLVESKIQLKAFTRRRRCEFH